MKKQTTKKKMVSIYPRQCEICSSTYKNKTAFCHHRKLGVCDKRKALLSSNVTAGALQQNNNNVQTVINGNVNIFVNSTDDISAILENLKTHSTLSQQDKKTIEPVQELLRNRGCTSVENILGLIERYSITAEDVLNNFTHDRRKIAADINRIMRVGSEIEFDEDADGVTFIKTSPRNVLAYFGEKFWIDNFLPSLTEKIDGTDDILKDLITRPVRKDCSGQYCDVRKSVEIVDDGRLMSTVNINEAAEAYFIKHGVSLDDVSDESCCPRQALAREEFRDKHVFDYHRWTRQKWDAFITNSLSEVMLAISKAIDGDHGDGYNVNTLLRNHMRPFIAKYVDQHEDFDNDTFLTIAQSTKKKLEKRVISDGKESLVAGWRLIIDYIEKSSKVNQRVTKSLQGKTRQMMLTERETAQIALHLK